MEISFKEFNNWRDLSNEIWEFNPRLIFGDLMLEKYVLDSKIIQLSPSKRGRIVKKKKYLEVFRDLTHRTLIIDEITENLAKIPDNEKLGYLNILALKTDGIVDEVCRGLGVEFYRKSKIDYNSTILKSGLGSYTVSGRLSFINGEHLQNQDELSLYLNLCDDFINQFNELQTFVNELRNGFQKAAQNGYTLNEILDKTQIVTPNTYNNKPNSKRQTGSKVKNLDLTFEQLFHMEYVEHVDKFIAMLREVQPPLLNEEGQWMFKPGASRVYYEVLRDKGIIKPINPAAASRAFEKKFGVNKSSIVDVPDLRRMAKPMVYEIYEDQFNHEIDIIKKCISTDIPYPA